MRRRSNRHRARPDPEARRVGERVRELRQELAFSFDAFVEELGMGRGYVSELERGLVVPSLTALTRVASVFETTVADLVLEDSLREQLFALTRSLSNSDVRQLMEAAGRMRGPGPEAVGARIGKKIGLTPDRQVGALPLFRIRPAAGAFSEFQEGGIEAWVKPGPKGPRKRGQFLVRITGRSMEPTIPDGALCLCERPWSMPQAGEVGIFVRHEAGDPADAGRYTLKEYRPTVVTQGGTRVIKGVLRPRNPAFAPLRAGSEDDQERPFARFLRVVG